MASSDPSTDALTALESRLIPLEHLLARSISEAQNGPLPTTDSVRARLERIQTELEQTVSGQPALERFVGDCESPSFALTETPAEGRITGPGRPSAFLDARRVPCALAACPSFLSEVRQADVSTFTCSWLVCPADDRNLPLLAPAFSLSTSPNPPPSPSSLPPQAQLALLLDLLPSLQQAATEFDRVSSLINHQKVLDRPLGSEADDMLPLLRTVGDAADKAGKEGESLDRRLGALVSRYDGFIDDVSRTFLAFHEELARCEVEVRRLEKERAV